MRKMTKLESLAEQKSRVEAAFSGQGRYKFQNRTKGDIRLPKPGLDGKKWLKPKEQFEGDSYFFSMVPRDLILVENLTREEIVEKPKILLTEQPPIYTTKGHVEYVQEDPAKKLDEQPKADGKLLVEPANDSVAIIR